MSTVGEAFPATDGAALATVTPHGPADDGGQVKTLSTARLVPLFYDELRKIAAGRLASERAGHSLQVTALTHEAVVRIMGGVAGERWASPADFFAAASEAMRRILIDAARRRSATKRGGGKGVRFEISALGLAVPDVGLEIVMVNDLLDSLAAADRLAADVVRLRYFGGLTVPEVATLLGVPRRTVDRRWAYARAWFGRHLRRAGEGGVAAGEAPAET